MAPKKCRMMLSPVSPSVSLLSCLQECSMHHLGDASQNHNEISHLLKWPLQNGVTQYGNCCQELRETGTCSLSWDVKWCSQYDASSQSWSRSSTSNNPTLSQQNLCVILSNAASWVCLQIQSISRGTFSSGVSDSGWRRKRIWFLFSLAFHVNILSIGHLHPGSFTLVNFNGGWLQSILSGFPVDNEAHNTELCQLTKRDGLYCSSLHKLRCGKLAELGFFLKEWTDSPWD